MGARHERRRARSRRSTRPAPERGRDAASSRAACAAPCSCCTATRTRIRDPRERRRARRRRRAAGWSRSRAAATRPTLRDPVRVNLLLREFLLPAAPPPTWRRARRAPAARALRLVARSASGTRGATSRSRASCAACVPASRSTGSPSRRRRRCSRRPASACTRRARELAGECAHIESRERAGTGCRSSTRCGAWTRSWSRTSCSSTTSRSEGAYDLWIGDEAWEVDHFLHENPELKSAPYAWLTDFVGYLPLPEGGEREAFLTADYNAEMVEQVERYPRVRDRAIFIGDPDDIVAGQLRARAAGDPAVGRGALRVQRATSPASSRSTPAARAALRRELGWGDGRADLPRRRRRLGRRRARSCRPCWRPGRRRAAAFPGCAWSASAARASIRARSTPASAELHGHVDDLHRWLDACDIAVVQGGLTTTMELVAARRPFLRFPLERHFEQRLHVAHRLARHGAGRRIEFADATPEVIAQAIAAELRRDGELPAGAGRWRGASSGADRAAAGGRSLRCGVGRLAPPGGGSVALGPALSPAAGLAVREHGHDAAVRVPQHDADARCRARPCSRGPRNPPRPRLQRERESAVGMSGASCRSRSRVKRARCSPRSASISRP